MYFSSDPLSCYKILRILGYLMTIFKESLRKFLTGKYFSHAFPMTNDL